MYTVPMITHEFYIRPAKELAPALLGKLLCVKTENGIIKKRITETEVYYGVEDTACYAHKGRSKKSLPLFEEGGMSYVTLVYGMHHMINIVTGPEGHPEAVLLRGIEGADGPGKLTKAMGITKELDHVSFTDSGILWLEDDGYEPACEQTPRIGIGYASKEDQALPWRFVIKE